MRLLTEEMMHHVKQHLHHATTVHHRLEVVVADKLHHLVEEVEAALEEEMHHVLVHVN
jgi:hypothetical protein